MPTRKPPIVLIPEGCLTSRKLSLNPTETVLPLFTSRSSSQSLTRAGSKAPKALSSLPLATIFSVPDPFSKG